MRGATKHAIGITAGLLLAVVALQRDWELLALFAGAYLAIALHQAGRALFDSLRPSTKADRRAAAAAEKAFRERQQATRDAIARGERTEQRA